MINNGLSLAPKIRKLKSPASFPDVLKLHVRETLTMESQLNVTKSKDRKRVL